jgi:hypothetical protein
VIDLWKAKYAANVNEYGKYLPDFEAMVEAMVEF